MYICGIFYRIIVFICLLDASADVYCVFNIYCIIMINDKLFISIYICPNRGKIAWKNDYDVIFHLLKIGIFLE